MPGMSLECQQSAALARKIRVQAAHMIHRAKSSHLGSAYSIADLLAVLYGRILRIDPKHPDAPDRDRFTIRTVRNLPGTPPMWVCPGWRCRQVR